MSSAIAFRPATPGDAEPAAALIFSAGPQALCYGFGPDRVDVLAFLAAAFCDGRGFFGWRNHVVAELDGEVAAVAASYNYSAYARLCLGHLAVVWRLHAPAAFVSALRRSLQLQALMPAPGQAMHYLANFGVREDLRGRGVGSAMLEYQLACARRLGRSVFALDVSVANPRAQALYGRLGMRVTALHEAPACGGRVPATRRMEMSL